MRPLACAIVLFGCGPPSWPETAWPGSPPVDDATRFSVEPADPIEGEDVLVTVPVATDGECYAFGATVRREESADTSIVHLEASSPDMCSPVAIAGSGSLVELGRLTAGHYVVRTGELDLSFDVRPATTPPGEPPLWWRAAFAVAVANHVGSACGERYEGGPPYRPWSLRAPRLYHQVAAAHPDWDADRVEAAMCAAQSVQIRWVSERELRYRHSSSSLCHTSESIGTVVVHEDGTLEVRAPYVLDGEDVPC